MRDERTLLCLEKKRNKAKDSEACRLCGVNIKISFDDESPFLSHELSMLCYDLINSIFSLTNQVFPLLEQITP